MLPSCCSVPIHCLVPRRAPINHQAVHLPKYQSASVIDSKTDRPVGIGCWVVSKLKTRMLLGLGGGGYVAFLLLCAHSLFGLS